jgi:hydrogenase maturation protease
MDILILGLGNILLRDEGVGVHAVNALAARYALPEGVEALDGGTSGMDLLDTVAGRDRLIVCDAIKSDAAPGSAMRIDGSEIAAFFATRVSPHQLGLCDMLANLELLGEKPAQVTIVGIVPEDLSLGVELSDAGRQGMEHGISLMLEELAAQGVPLAPESMAVAGGG